MNSLYKKIALFATCLAFLVVIFGAYVRLSNAGLGCPDWPGCYGKLIVPDSFHVEKNYPNSFLETHKAWKEMIHRYLAGSLGGSIFLLMVLSIGFKKRNSEYPIYLPFLLFGMVVYQALLGMWTVTIKLHPLVVTAHLLGGFTTLGLLWWNYLSVGAHGSPCREAGRAPLPSLNRLNLWIILGLLLLLFQISLGAWTSSNYAALACPDFPTCQGNWIPSFNFQEAFHLSKEFGPNYEGGVLNNESRMTIHFLHRVGAVFVFVYLSILSIKIFKRGFKKNAFFLASLLILQLSLCISNVIFQLPLSVAVAHNGVAALLFLSLIRLNHLSKPKYPFWLILGLGELTFISWYIFKLKSMSGFGFPL